MCGKNIGKIVFLMCLDVPSCTLICVLYPAICQDQSECDDFFYSFSFLNHHNATEISNSEDCWKRERYQDMIFDLWLQFCAWLQERIPIEEVFQQLQCTREGLSLEEVEEHSKLFGLNKLEENFLSLITSESSTTTWLPSLLNSNKDPSGILQP